MDNNPMPQPDDEHIISDVEALKIYFDPVRIRIMQELVNQPRTIQEVAAALGVPFTRLYYQFNLLEKHGFIRVVKTRSLPGAVEEKYYQVAARLFVVARPLLALVPDDEQLNIVMDTVLGQTRTDCLKSIHAGVVDMQAMPPHPDALLLRRFVFRMTREQARQFQQQLLDMVKNIQTQDTEADDPYYAITLAMYPTIFIQD